MVLALTSRDIVPRHSNLASLGVLLTAHSHMHDKRKKYNGGISPRYIFHVGALGITIRNDTITGHHHAATMLSVALLYRGNTSHHNAIPLLDQIEQDMA